VRFNRRVCVGKQQRHGKACALDFITGLGRDTARILEYRLDIAVVARREYRNVHRRLLLI
jgi:hypothetical protein